MKHKTIQLKKGKKGKSLDLPDSIFKHEVNKQLMRQAVRVYRFNQRQGNAHTKSRSEVRGSGRKIWQQKGTGRARHGDRYAPIFVGGGIAHGPKSKDWSLKLPGKMKRKALFSALSTRLKQGSLQVVEGLEELKPKTKIFYKTLVAKLNFEKGEKLILIVNNPGEESWRGAQNIPGIKLLSANNLNTYQVLLADRIFFTRKGMKNLTKIYASNKK